MGDSKIWVIVLAVGIVAFVGAIVWYEYTKDDHVSGWTWLLLFLSLFLIGLSFGIHAIMNEDVPHFSEVVYKKNSWTDPGLYTGPFTVNPKTLCPPPVDVDLANINVQTSTWIPESIQTGPVTPPDLWGSTNFDGDRVSPSYSSWGMGSPVEISRSPPTGNSWRERL